MEILEISNDNIDSFRSLVGEDVSDDLRRVYYRGIGALDDNDRAVGAVVFELLDSESDEDTKSRIRLAKYKNEEVERGLQQFYTECSVSEEEIAESLYEFPDEAEADAFSKAGFSKEKKESDEILITLEEIGELGSDKKKKVPEYIKSLSQISVLQYREAVKKILFKGQKGIVEDLPYLPKEWFDEEVSACALSDNKVDGLFLVRKTPSGMLIPVLLYAYGPDFKKNLIYMLTSAATHALALYPPNTPMLINRKNPGTRALVGKFLPNVSGADVYCGSRKE